MDQAILYYLTRTPLHIGAGASVGAIDQPIVRERHTGFPLIPATGQKGSYADGWPGDRVILEDGEKDKRIKVVKEIKESAWLFGSDTTDLPFAGSLIFSEARVLAFPIRSAKGSYAWITCPMMLHRAKRDGVPLGEIPKEPTDGEAIFKTGDGAKLDLGQKIVLEEYCFKADENSSYSKALAQSLADLVPDDKLFATIADRLVILGDGMMSYFTTTACEIAQHVRINDETGTAEDGGLFNQENVPADTLFYAPLSATASRVPQDELKGKKASEAMGKFKERIIEKKVFQFGGDATTGLGWCSVYFADKKEEMKKGETK